MPTLEKEVKTSTGSPNPPRKPPPTRTTFAEDPFEEFGKKPKKIFLQALLSVLLYYVLLVALATVLVYAAIKIFF